MTPKERRRLERQRQLLLRRLIDRPEFLRGSVVLMKRPCGRPGCPRCAAGQRHPTWVLTYSQAGKTHTVYLGERRVDRARQLVQNYRRLTQTLEQLAQLNLALFKADAARGPKGDAHGAQGNG